MRFNAKQFLSDFFIPYTEDGANTSEDFININCPFCSDHSFHLGVNRSKGYANCWKCGYHSIYDLIKRLLPKENPKAIMIQYDSNISLKKHLNKEKNKPVSSIIVPGDRLLKIHKDYLMKRDFDPDYLENKYDIKGTTHTGSYKFRIMAPVYFQNKIVTFQGRDITNKQKARYKACPKELEIKHHKYILYNLDNCKKDFVVVTEGFMKVFRLGENSVATFGKNFTIPQLYLLSQFKRVFIFFDPDEAGQSASDLLSSQLDLLGVEVYNIENEYAPDDMNNEDARHFMKNI